jgi:hypothetical protein
MVGRGVLPFREAGHDLRIRVLFDRDQGTDDRQLVPHARLQREMLANLHAGYVCGDGPELAPEFLGRLGLEVVHIEVRRPARQVDHDG